MSWPLISDFSRMLQNPKVAFRDPRLRDCRIELDSLGQPRARSGNFASVYKAIFPDGRELAVRVFNRAVAERLDHYQAIDAYLEERAVAGLVHFDYDQKGVRSASDGKLYPLLTMEWVPGVSLYDWTGDRCREGYQQALAIGADVWLQLVRDLQSNNIVHGDLQHGNVLVSNDGYFKLVDYDGMGVPDLMGRRNLEVGLEPYQHPARDENTPIYPGLDNFSALVIYVALRALAANPRLWHTYVESTGYDKLLFRKEDFSDPGQSYLYHELMNSPDEQVRDLTHYLFELSRYRLFDVPPIDEVLLWCNSIEDLLSARDWDTAVELVKRMGPGEQIPAHLQQQVNEAVQRVQCREALERAIATGDEGEIERAYAPRLLDDYPAAAPLVEQARVAGQVRRAIDLLESALRYQAWDKFRDVWRENQQLLTSRRSARKYREEAKRIYTADSIRKLLKDPASEDESVLEAWKYLQQLGGHPSAEDLKPEIKRRSERRSGLTHFEALLKQAPAKPSTQHDRQLVSAWKPELFEGSPQLKQHASAFHAARDRLARMEKLIQLSQQPTLEAEKQFVQLAQGLPASYHPKLEKRQEVARRRVKAVDRLTAALDKPAPIREQGEAYRAVRAAKAEPLLDDKQRERGEAALRRLPAVEALAELSENWPPHVLDERLLDAWDEERLADCLDDPEVRRWRQIRAEALERRKVLADMEEAAEVGDFDRFRALHRSHAIHGYHLPPSLQQGLRDLEAFEQRAAEQRRQALLQAVLDGDKLQFVELYDLAMLREIAQRAPHHAGVIGSWTESEVLPLGRCGLGPPSEGDAIHLEGDPVAADEDGPPPPDVRLRWQWPSERIAADCVVVIADRPPKRQTQPDDLDAARRIEVSRGEYERAQGLRLPSPPREWNELSVSVWAVLDLGFQTYYSEPICLGPLPLVRKKSSGWSLFG